ncbi:lipid-A-disaccharide synthase N-terminal domain-containing protein [Xanthobacter flavus]|uniref:lipid-A-disaccharide synthase N-terminal domain-containing protein n=1 Tax=Xanthobacter flavus TaxID=281 RepID=UPI00372C32FE
MVYYLSQIGRYMTEVFIDQFDWWVALGLVAQFMFTMRFVVQWIASERAQRSVIPFAFWTFSLGGGSLLLVYAIYRKDPVFIAGQALSTFIYVRNLQFALRERRANRAVT